MYRTILVPLDGSSLGEYALPLALGIARRACATIELVHVCTPLEPNVFGGELDAPVLGAERREQMRAWARTYLDQLATCLSTHWEVAMTTTALDGPAADALYDHAVASNADLVVMTTHGHGSLARAWMGSVADKLMRRLPMPVLLTRPHEQALDILEGVHEHAFEHVLIPLDGSALAEQAVEPAVALGELMGAEYTLMQAIEPVVLSYAPAAQAVALDEQTMEQWRAEALAYLEHLARRMRQRGLIVRTSVAYGPPPIAIIDYAREQAADLIAISTHGRGGIARLLLGSVADKVVRGASVPVLIIRPHGDAAQITALSDIAAANHEE